MDSLVAGFLAYRARSGRGFPERIGVGDLILAGIATHKLSRLLAKDRVTAPLRAPFTEFQGEGGVGEVEESPRGRGRRRAIGELLVCSILAAVAISDFLQVLYKGSEEKLL